MDFKNLISTLLIGIFSFLSCSAQNQSKHLFILSGQSNMVRLHPEETFLPSLQDALGSESIIVVKDAMGSQSIRRWYKDWNDPNGAVPDVRGDLYDRLLQKVRDSIKTQNIASVTFIWMQGERDARMQFSSVYEASLLGLYQQICEDLNRRDINMVIGRLNDFDMTNTKWPHWTKIRDIQIQVGNSNPRFVWVDTDDLNDGINSEGKAIQNDLHLSVEGYKILGKRFAEAALQLLKDNGY